MTLFEAIDIYIDARGLAKAYATMKGEYMDLRLMCLYLRNPDFSKITDTNIIQYLRTLVAYGWTQNGVYKKSIVFRSFWKYCNQKKFPTFDYNLIPIVKHLAKPPKVATKEQYEKILDVIPDRKVYNVRNKAVLTLLKHSGMRCGELVSMDIDENFKPEKCTAIIKTEKSRGLKPFRQVFWYDKSGEAKKAMEKWLEVREKFAKIGEFENPHALFVGFNNQGWGKRITNHQVDSFLRRYAKMAHEPNINPHSLRHMFAHDIVKAGGTNSDVMNLLGHSKMESSSIYTQMYGAELEERYLKLKSGKRG